MRLGGLWGEGWTDFVEACCALVVLLSCLGSEPVVFLLGVVVALVVVEGWAVGGLAVGFRRAGGMDWDTDRGR